MKKRLKKRKGELPGYMIVVCISVISFLVIILESMGGIKAFDQYLAANVIARKYMFRMESYTNGYLSGDDAGRLKEDLQNQGLSNIDLSGTTMSEVQNGGDIYLDIKYDQTYKQIEIQNYNIKVVSVTKRVEIPLSSTSKN